MRAAEILAVGGVLAGAAWWIQCERRRDRTADRTANRLLALAQAQAVDLIAPAAPPPRTVAAIEAANPIGPSSLPPPPRPAATPAPTAPVRTSTAAPSNPPAALTRTFDSLFRAHGQGIPVAYLRALAHAESGLRPDARLGLISVVPIALEDFNQRNPLTPVQPADLRDPATSTRVAADTLRTIIASYRRHHPDVRNLVEDWRNPRFIELLTAGWNAGFSEAGGVGRVARFLRSRPVATPGADDLTVDAVFAAAAAAGATRHLSNPAKLAFAKRVTEAYLREVVRDANAAHR